jgi:predicted nucleotidyltransferase
MEINEVLNQIVEQLKPADPYKIILFGSQATGKARKDSDIDLMVVLDNYHISKTYTEHIDKQVEVNKLVLDINEKYAMDILVYSKAELKKVKEYGNSFVNKIEKEGKVIYEKRN